MSKHYYNTANISKADASLIFMAITKDEWDTYTVYPCKGGSKITIINYGGAGVNRTFLKKDDNDHSIATGYVMDQPDLSGYAPLVSPIFTGTPTAPTPATNTNNTQIATTAFVKAVVADVVSGAPAALDTLYELSAALGGDSNFSTTVMTLIGQKAPLASPAFTGTPTVPTAGPGTNTTQIASTAYVVNALGAYAPLASPTFTGTPTVPTAVAGTNTTQIASTAFVVNALSSYAPLASPALTGTPTAPTAALNTNTTQLATTAFVANEAASRWKIGGNVIGANTFFGATDAFNIEVGTLNKPIFWLNASSAGATNNYIRVYNALTGLAPTFEMVGSDTNINFDIKPKGTGSTVFYHQGSNDGNIDYKALSFFDVFNNVERAAISVNGNNQMKIKVGTTTGVFSMSSNGGLNTSGGFSAQQTIFAGTTNPSITSTQTLFRVNSGTWLPSSGSNTYSAILIDQLVINQTGTATGETNFVYIKPTITANTALVTAFRSTIPLGTNRYNLYLDGTANNYLAGNTSFGTTTNTAGVTLGGASTTKAAMRFIAGALPTGANILDGNLSYEGNNLYLTVGTTDYVISKTLNVSATLDFPATGAASSSDLTVTVTGAALNDVVDLGVPNGSVDGNVSFFAWVSAANTVTVRCINNNALSGVNPASGTFKISVNKS